MKIAIIGAAYTGLAAAKYFKNLGHSISVTTTQESRREELKQVAKVFRKNGFDTEIITDNPENPRKRTVYLVMKKE